MNQTPAWLVFASGRAQLAGLGYIWGNIFEALDEKISMTHMYDTCKATASNIG